MQYLLPPHIKAEGKGTVKVEPDQAVVTVGVVTKNQNAESAQNENGKITNKVISALEALGIGEKEIETASYSINREVDYVNGQKIERGYIVNHQLMITINDLKKIGSVLDTAVKAGANVVHSLRFQLRDENKVYRQALKEAVSDARKKVNAIATSLKVSVYAIPYSIEERSTGIVRPFDTMQLESVNKGTKIMTKQVEVTANISMICTIANLQQ
ncbi:SIMPL domain-containing protein [Lottiidibacillus patelloidae]|uniref:SIMPL domain-containing protein n=1 Tax=Lottiidibacillus patelloidae TaxID=2670334 RepID=UPI001303A731|nr:SIMPL domain-containing protein [Lottiidibacillus patelloidae]